MDENADDERATKALTALGERYREGCAKGDPPIGDTIINGVRDAVWDAWQLGLEQPRGGHYYPSLPLLDQLTASFFQSDPSKEEHEPEIGD